jgi:hypothetical protein
MNRTKRVYFVIILGISLVAAFLVGWEASRRFKVRPNPDIQRSYLAERGDASNPLRAEVLASLREFQDSYTKRDPHQLTAFMEDLFSRGQDTRLIGTDADEWRNGYDSVAQFIGDDWREWGNLQLDVNDAAVSSAGDAAWLATTGKVIFHGSPRAIRFTAVLTRRNGRWVFRQIQFQWDERLMRFSDLFSKQAWPRL